MDFTDSELAKIIRDVPDFPKAGIIFKDITTLLHDGKAFSYAIDRMAERYQDHNIDSIASVEARGFIFGAPLACKLGVGFLPVRKPGKLPYKTVQETYDLEYGTDTVEVHEDAVKAGDKVLLVDDLLATGGTIGATAKLITKLGGDVAGYAFLIELTFLNGRDKLGDLDVFSLIRY
ncbi:MAG: adenine phosphoribosyltransferase [bacterium]